MRLLSLLHLGVRPNARSLALGSLVLALLGALALGPSVVRAQDGASDAFVAAREHMERGQTYYL